MKSIIGRPLASIRYWRDFLASLQGELAGVKKELAETKAGVSVIQHELSKALPRLVVLESELAEVKRDVAQASSASAAIRRDFVARETRDALAALNRVAAAVLEPASAETLPPEVRGAFATYLTRSVGRLLFVSEFPMDPYPDDDFTEEYAIRCGVYALGPGSEVEVGSGRERMPWRHLIAHADCGVFLVLGQSNAANHGDTRYAAQEAVYNLDFLRMNCYRAEDPLAGASGDGGSVWSRLGDRLVAEGVFRRVLFMPIAFGGSFITDWTPGKPMHRRLRLALSRLQKELGTLLLPFSGVIWQQGEAEANHTQMTAAEYRAHFGSIVTDLRVNNVFAPVFVACATLCQAGPHLHDNAAAIREAQSSLPDAGAGIFEGPDTDTIDLKDRYDGCHLSAAGLKRCSELWFEVLTRHRALLAKL